MISKLLEKVKAEAVVEHGRLYLTYYNNKYTIFLDQRLVLQINSTITYSLFNRYAARVAKDVLAILKPEAKVVYPYIMIGDQVCSVLPNKP